MSDIRDIARLYDIRDILGLSGNVDRIICPLPGHIHYNNTPSFSIIDATPRSVQMWRCWGMCDAFGDVIDLVGRLHIPGYDSARDVHRAIALLDEKHEFSTPKTVRLKENLGQMEYMDYLPPSGRVIAYARHRGISEEAVEAFRIGSDGNYMSIPAFDENGVLKSVKFRNTESVGPRFRMLKGSKGAIFNSSRIAYTTKPLLIVKSEIVAMVMWSKGIQNVCAPVWGETADISQWNYLFSLSPKRVYVGDNDRKPETRETMNKAARDRCKAIRAELRFPPEAYKDLDDWALADPGAVEVVQAWLA